MIFRLNCISESVSPITHMMGTAGNEALINRETIVFRDGVKHLPIISGNAIRHRAIREPGVKYLLNAYELEGSCSLQLLNFLFNGGSRTEKGVTENARKIAEMKRLFPLLRILGSALPDSIVAGSIDVWRGKLLCEENRHSIKALLPDKYELPKQRLMSAEKFVKPYQYTRADAKNRPDAWMYADTDLPEGKSNLMIHAGQSVIPGSLWHHGFIIKQADELTVGALILSLELWQKSGGTIGGMYGIGHGIL